MHCLHKLYVASTAPRDVPYFSKESIYFLLLSYASLLEWVEGGGSLISHFFLILLWYTYAETRALERDTDFHHRLYVTSNNQHLELGKLAFPINETIYNLYNAFSQQSYFLSVERLTLM